MTLQKMSEQHLENKRVLIRADLNVPVKNGQVTSDARILASLPTLQKALKQGAKVMVMSHLGRPTEGAVDPEFSLQPIAHYLQQKLEIPVRLASDYLKGCDVASGELVVLENVRFNQGEKANETSLAQDYANLCDIFIMDAFGTAHRKEASTYGVAQFAPISCAGPLLCAELDALDKAMQNPKKPMIAIVGGSKVSTKLTVLESLANIADQIIVGGGILNTFLAAGGYPVGQSLYEPDLIPQAKALMAKIDIPMPSDVRVAQEFSDQATATIKHIGDVSERDQILDLGDQSAAQFAARLQQANTILWNGPVGVFEFEHFRHGTQVLSQAIADSNAFSIAGGGDTLAAIDLFKIADQVSYISTGGGAFLEFVEGKKLPAVEVLEQRA